MLYDFDRFAIDTDDAVRVKVFPDGEEHVMSDPPLALVLEVSEIIAGSDDGMSVADARKCSELVSLAFPSMAASGELDRLSATQLFRLVALVRDGDLPALGSRTAGGKAATEAAAVSSSPSPATPGPSSKTRKRSGKG